MLAKRKLILYCFFLVLQNVANAINEPCRSNDYCRGINEACSTELQQCKCKEGTQLFADECLGISHYGERCRRTIECSKSGDGYLHCIKAVCRCGNGRTYDTITRKCEQDAKSHVSQTAQKGFHTRKMVPRDTSRSVVVLDDKFKDIKHVG